jgi:hypothetical protein
MKIKILLLCLIIGLLKPSKANELNCFPSVRIGYVFSASFSLGFDLNILANTPINIPDTNYSINFSQTFTNVKTRRVDKGFHTNLQIKGVLRTPFRIYEWDMDMLLITGVGKTVVDAQLKD